MLPVVDCWHGLKRNSTKIIDGILYVCYVTDSDARGNYVFEKIKSIPLSAEFGGYFSVKTNVSATGIESKSHFKYLLYALFIFILGMFVIAFILYSRIQNKKKLIVHYLERKKRIPKKLFYSFPLQTAVFHAQSRPSRSPSNRRLYGYKVQKSGVSLKGA